ncbi:hypothetical protein A0E43_19275 [Pectobacterium cacticida]|uniref:hypothetical protein n=1 Tax=Pectobacterium cacticida TaxID=69221 RepID=UPI003985AF37
MVVPLSDWRARPARGCAEFLGLRDARESHEAGQVTRVRPPGLDARLIGKPLRLGWHVGQTAKLRHR